MEPWLAPEKTTLPDFIICGAMKSGTTTLHNILAAHPQIFMPQKEVLFFDRDSLIQHPDFHQFKKGQWQTPLLTPNEQKNAWQWYHQQFSSAGSTQICGEDSTTYLASEKAIERIAQQTKPIKLIIMLRQPTSRALSQYWHLVRTGKVGLTLEDVLRYSPASILDRSLYVPQIERLLKFIPRSQIKFITFESLLKDKSAVINDVLNFIGAPVSALPKHALSLHSNATTYPKYYSLQLLKNRLFPFAGFSNYVNYFTPEPQSRWQKVTVGKVINRAHGLINPQVKRKPIAINTATLALLDDYFSNCLTGLDELIEQDVMSQWFTQ